MRRTTVSPGAPLRERAIAVMRTVAGEVGDDRLLGLAAETAFFAVLSLFPALLIATSLLSMLDTILGADLAMRAQSQVLESMDQLLTDRAAGAVSSVEQLFQGSQGGVLTIATLGALVTLSGAFATVVNALNLAYDTEERRTWVRRRLLGLVLGLATMLILVVLFAALVIGPLLGAGGALAQLVGLGEVFTAVWDALRLPVALAGVMLWAAFLFHVAPNRRSTWRQSLPGAVLTACLWVLASAGFHLYLVVVGDRSPVLGAFGGGAIVMLWAYLLSISLLVGGELNAVLQDRRYLDGSMTGGAAPSTRRPQMTDDDKPVAGARSGPDDVSSALSPPERHAKASRNVLMLTMAAIAVLCFVVVLIVLAVT
jgi:membrane protein